MYSTTAHCIADCLDSRESRAADWQQGRALACARNDYIVHKFNHGARHVRCRSKGKAYTLSTMVQPAARAGAVFHAAMSNLQRCIPTQQCTLQGFPP